MDQKSHSKSIQRKIKSNPTYTLFGNTCMDELHPGKLFIHLFGEYFSRYRIKQAILFEGLIKHLIKEYSLSANQIIRVDNTKDNNAFALNIEESEVCMILKESLMLEINRYWLQILYGPSISESERNDLIQTIDQFKFKVPYKQFYMVQSCNGSLELAEFDIKQINLDINTHYNDDFPEINNLVIESLNSKGKSGIFLLHGKYGTGKTTYLRHLISNIDKKFLYFPVNMIERINSPDFLPFIAKQQDSVIILEDCESLLVQRDSGLGNASALSNLLNLSDGLLGDALSITTICTFNAGIRKIDDALLRKGRLLARYEFKELEIEKAQQLAESIGKKVKVDKPMTVADIYNIDEKSFDNVTKSIGFKAA
jgi:hypothetical protein